MAGRFLQNDPVGYDGGMNMYAYTGGDPVNGSDPSGLAPYQYYSDPNAALLAARIDVHNAWLQSPSSEWGTNVYKVDNTYVYGSPTQGVNLGSYRNWDPKNLGNSPLDISLGTGKANDLHGMIYASLHNHVDSAEPTDPDDYFNDRISIVIGPKGDYNSFNPKTDQHASHHSSIYHENYGSQAASYYRMIADFSAVQTELDRGPDLMQANGAQHMQSSITPRDWQSMTGWIQDPNIQAAAALSMLAVANSAAYQQAYHNSLYNAQGGCISPYCGH